jgi:catalase
MIERTGAPEVAQSRSTPRLPVVVVGFMLALLFGSVALIASAQSEKSLAEQIFDVMVQLPGNKPGNRLVHAKGIVCQGTFTPTKEAANLSRAKHFSGPTVPITVRFSDAAPSPSIADFSPDAAPRGMAIRFAPKGGDETDIVSFSHNGFVVANGDEFLALQKSVVATDPSKPHPWPVEAFLSTHPRALKFVQDPKPTPVSFSTEAFYGNNAFLFINKKDQKQAGRYQILPDAGQQHISDADAKSLSPDFLVDELRTHLAKSPAKFRLMLQLPIAGDPTNDPSIVWPDDRKTIELGTIAVTAVVADSDAAQKALAFDPMRLTDGITMSDDTLPSIRSQVYLLSRLHRQSQ